MCFVFILTANKWYIFFEEKIKKCHTEMVCGVVKGATVRAKENRLIEKSKNESSDL